MSYAVFGRSASASVIPRHIKSASASGLERKMLEVQKRLKGQAKWTIVVKGNEFYAWYVVDIDLDESSKANQAAGESR